MNLEAVPSFLQHTAAAAATVCGSNSSGLALKAFSSLNLIVNIAKYVRIFINSSENRRFSSDAAMQL